MEIISVPKYFGELVFDDRVMKSRLSDKTYESLKKTIDEGANLELSVADSVAEAMRNWAIEKGATHYTHWFQPLTGITAEKHESFIEPSPDGGVIMKFSGKELIQGEPDASSFPSGGLRATFEARGYTTWDPTSYAFIKNKTLCIPTAFCSYSGDALDKKTPLLRSMVALNKQALRILKLFGNNTTKYVHTSVGAEQEYFLITKEMYDKRPDLKFTGRTLFGTKPPKGQEMDDHYFGVIKPKVQTFMDDLNVELWKLGILAKTEHNEVAPSQHELAPIFTTTNIATDQNQLTMEIMQKVASKHGLVCLLHEKPFAGVNGSGKHNNWSMTTDDGINLLSPGATPYENAQFLLFLCAVIKAVDDYQDLLRISVATASNDHRLGANEASLGSSNSIACANIMLNSAVAESLKVYADRLEGSSNFKEDLHSMIRNTIKDHKRILFNGNGYDALWVKEATEVRGLLNYTTTPDCMPHSLDEKNVKMLTSHKVFTINELKSRCEIMLDNYCKQVKIEANTMIEMTLRMILPSIECYIDKLCATSEKRSTVIKDLNCKYEESLIKKLSVLLDNIYSSEEELAEAVSKIDDASNITEQSYAIRDNVIPKMNVLRGFVDEAETYVSKDCWPMPSYGDILFSVK